MKGTELIAIERGRQINQEGYSSDHDDEHEGGQLAIAAVCYATPKVIFEKEDYANEIHFKALRMDGWFLKVPHDGNVIYDNDTVSNSERINQLVKAGALIAAEIDRIQRLKDH